MRPQLLTLAIRRGRAMPMRTRYHSTDAAGPLAGIRVLDLTRILAGPFCTMLLGDLGAEVIKVEHPLRGDDTRSWGPPFKLYERPPGSATPKRLYREPPTFPGESAYYLCANRNKQSIAIDIKREEGRRILVDLARSSDVLVENYVPGKLALYGLGYEQLREVNPRLIYASITGYGSTGPYCGRPGYDVIVEAEAGLMHITGEEGGGPVKVGVAVTDLATGLYVHGAIMAALIARMRTGRGQHLDASLLQTQVSMLANIGSNFLVGGEEAQRWGTRHPSIVPYEVFATSDGSLCIGAGNNAQFLALCQKLDLAHLAKDPRFLTNADRVKNRLALVAVIGGTLAKMITAEVLACLEGAGLPYGPVNNIAQTFAHPQVAARGVVREIRHPFAGSVRVVGPAVAYSESSVDVRLPPPMLGQHTELVLRSVLGYTDQQIERAVEGGGATMYNYR
ncbi:hypothetical protein H4S07_000173 [Coemansia furcata]|uniref:Uncharacterized protein n=1 Tax=Coemansia furcata TaxID=417177 RepID=A0ACC1LSW6_9FUNG|nr:hypothetical protein H4S07_000173 [Coemansia furcata]